MFLLKYTKIHTNDCSINFKNTLKISIWWKYW